MSTFRLLIRRSYFVVLPDGCVAFEDVAVFVKCGPFDSDSYLYLIILVFISDAVMLSGFCICLLLTDIIVSSSVTLPDRAVSRMPIVTKLICQ